MKILHVITGLELGGAETVLCRLAGTLRNHRHAVVSLGGTGSLGAALEGCGAQVLALELRSPFNLLAVGGRFRKRVQEFQPDVIQSWLIHANCVATILRAVCAPRTSLVWNVRQGLDALDKEKWLTRKIVSASPYLSAKAQAIVYNSTHSAQAHEALGYPPQLRKIIPNGFDLTEFFPDQADRLRMRSELCLDDEALLIGLVGRFHPVKNHAGFFEAAERVLTAHPDARFLVAGAAAHGDEVNRLVGDGALRNRLLALGPRTDIARLTRALDIACNVSHSEAFPNAVGEAMASGVPCVVTPVGDSRTIVGGTGIVARSTSGEAIADALFRMIDLGSDARAELGRSARARIAEHYSLSASASGYERLYEGVSSPSLVRPAR